MNFDVMGVHKSFSKLHVVSFFQVTGAVPQPLQSARMFCNKKSLKLWRQTGTYVFHYLLHTLNCQSTAVRMIRMNLYVFPRAATAAINFRWLRCHNFDERVTCDTLAVVKIKINKTCTKSLISFVVWGFLINILYASFNLIWNCWHLFTSLQWSTYCRIMHYVSTCRKKHKAMQIH